MTRRITYALLLTLLLSVHAQAAGWHKTVADAQKIAKAKNQLILVDMFADWCGWCHRFEREVFPSQVFQTATADIVLLRLDTEDKAEGTRYARKYNVTSLPTFLLLTPDLTIAGFIRGYLPPNEFVRALGETRKKHEAYAARVKNESKLAKNDYAGRLALAKEMSVRSIYDQAEPRFKTIATTKGVPPAIRDEAYYELALLYVMQSKYDDAAKTLRKLTSVSQTGESAERGRLLLGQVYYEQGNLLSAASELRNFKKAYPKSPLLKNVDMLLPTIERRLAGK